MLFRSAVRAEPDRTAFQPFCAFHSVGKPVLGTAGYPEPAGKTARKILRVDGFFQNRRLDAPDIQGNTEMEDEPVTRPPEYQTA